MNRIIIIGNGFDKAHGLLTGYGDFMNYLKDSIAKYEQNKFTLANGIKCEKSQRHYHRLNKGKEDLWIGGEQTQNKFGFKFNLKSNPHNESIYFKSLFQEKEKLGYWSSLESHYFKLIYSYKDSVDAIEIINSEFNHLKTLLSEYLKLEIEEKIQGNSEEAYKYPFYNLLEQKHPNFEFKKNYFVTFNYTSKILNQYFHELQRDCTREKFPLIPIHIHGKLNSDPNPIIFGYGDEDSNEYKELEHIQNNKLLENFKTFQYLRSNNYNQVLGLLEQDDEIYIQIIGHSCGLCDKALLRTIFQHKNVKHIEATYHKEESKYFENLYNISRIFDDNTLMREKIIPLSETFYLRINKKAQA